MRRVLRFTPFLLLLSLSLLTATAQEETGTAVQIIQGRTETTCKHPGIRRIRTYDVSSAEIPRAFEGFRILFFADTHYTSLFTTTTLESLGRVIQEIAPDAMFLGGDYQEGCEYVEPLFSTIMSNPPQYGTYAVLGNNDLERCTDTIKSVMNFYNVALVEDTAVQIHKNGSHITVAGAINTYQKVETAPSPTLKLDPHEFVFLLTHTPDYAEDQDITNADLVLAGHTHGGQVTLFGAFAPVTSSHYGQRFLKGLNYNSARQAVITTTGIGTSRRAVRMFAPSEVVLITLHSWSHGEKLPEPAIALDTKPMISKPLQIKQETLHQETLSKPQDL